MMTAARIAELKALCDKATPGPWENIGGNVKGPDDYYVASDVDISACDDDDGEFIAAARTALPEALALVERYQAALQRIAENYCMT